MKDVLSVLTFAIGALFMVAFFSTLKPATVTVAEGEKPDRCSLTASSTPHCLTGGFAALSWSVAAMATEVAQEHLPRSH